MPPPNCATVSQRTRNTSIGTPCRSDNPKVRLFARLAYGTSERESGAFIMPPSSGHPPQCVRPPRQGKREQDQRGDPERPNEPGRAPALGSMEPGSQPVRRTGEPGKVRCTNTRACLRAASRRTLAPGAARLTNNGNSRGRLWSLSSASATADAFPLLHFDFTSRSSRSASSPLHCPPTHGIPPHLDGHATPPCPSRPADNADAGATVEVPDGPGLGVEYDWDYIEENALGGRTYE